ncbi:MAG TPA: zinc ribbon domain-containing protein [Pyrinomonadaceae bacterium]|nr:zinc ribbon domain-containing protein [Pyrinomonadaceae bacterium]
MFCPKCATQNLDGASFCRTCGANISLVPQALTGQITRPEEEKSLAEETSCFKPGRRRRELTLESAFKNLFLGIAFVFIAIALSRTIGAGWWFWMLIPAAMMMGTGIAQYMRLKERPTRSTPVLPPPVRATEHLMPPAPSVTEGTTRHLTSHTSEHR